LDFAIVPDVAQPNAFDEALISDPPIEAVIHTASPFHFNVTDIQKDLLDPAINGTTGILKAIVSKALQIKRMVRMDASIMRTADLVQYIGHHIFIWCRCWTDPRVSGQSTLIQTRTGVQ
jgi:hypothetical protein